MTLRRTLTQQLQAALSETDNLAFIVVFELVVRLDLSVGNLLHHFHDIRGLANEPNKLLILGFNKLKQRPDRDVLKGGISAGEKPAEVAVNAVARICPALDEYRIIAH